MLTLRMDGMKKIQRGVTTLEEVVKETAGCAAICGRCWRR
jgi:bacterioferritin-associated ferredoxin